VGAPQTARAKSEGRRTSSFSRLRAAGWIVAACLLLLAGVIGSLLGARAVTRSDADKQRLAFHLAATEITSTLKLAIQHEEDLVVNASAFIADNPTASAERFDRWLETVHAMARYPELENVGLVGVVPAAKVPAFARYVEAHPVEGVHARQSERGSGNFTILPAGPRPFYCFALAGRSRSPADYLPAGLDYCAFSDPLIQARDTGQSSYAPFKVGATTTLGVQTPVYRGGRVPATVAARRRAFIGWLGELLEPNVLLTSALQGHPNTVVTFRYDSGSSHIVFRSGRERAGDITTTISLHNGWRVRTATPRPSGAVLHDSRGLTLLIGGSIMSGLLALLVLVLGTGRLRARALVRQKTRELSHQALHDALTGLPNRALVLDRAERMLARTAREAGVVAGALFVDVDGFKHVNDNLGHAAGDRLLQVVGERLQRAVRHQDTVGRLGGDEFVVLVETRAGEETADRLADRLIEALREPVELGPSRAAFAITASIGVATGQYATPDALLRDADLALYAAKNSGKDRYSLFDASMNDDVEGRAALEADLAGAVEGNQLYLLYQPIFDLLDERVAGVEALVRWRHPVRGVLAPDSFIPLAEESGLIVPIGRWVLEEACRQAAAWAAAGQEIGVSVNVAADQLSRDGFAEDVRRALRTSGLEPASLMLELTETALMRDVQAASRHLHEIRALGVRVAIDDFGTGYASLSQLQRMPVDILKIDRAFVAALDDGGPSRDLLEAILGVGRSLSLKVVAEGIEAPEQLAALRAMGCEMAQGFYLGRPAPAEVLDGLLGLRSEGHTLAWAAS
jgi:diguanylate cyclase (GGDEF)-like protein